MSPMAVDQLAVEHQPLAFRIAQKYAHILPLDELRSEAVLILLVVAREYGKGEWECTFATFAHYRVQQRLIDYIRRRLGRYGQRGGWEMRLLDVDSVNADSHPASEDNTEEQAERDDLVERLTAAIGLLDRRDAYIIYRHYIKGDTLKIIARQLSCSEPRISQLHRRALKELQATLSAHGYHKSPAQLTSAGLS